jgi:NADH-quinone oxidoreductase subunit C
LAPDDQPVEDAEAGAGVAAAEPEPELLHGVAVTHSCGQQVLHPSREQLVDLTRRLRDAGFVMCVDVTGVDYLGYRGPRGLPAGIEAERFEVVVMLLSHAERKRLRLRVQVPESDPLVPSLFEIHPGTEAMEREVFDMFGIRFDGHPDLSRILMPEDWIGHPLRKDYAVGRIPVQFKGAPAHR